MDCGLWTVESGEWTVDCGLWTVKSGLWDLLMGSAVGSNYERRERVMGLAGKLAGHVGIIG